MIRRGALRACFHANGARKNISVSDSRPALNRSFGAFLFPVNNAPFVSEPYQKAGVYE